MATKWYAVRATVIHEYLVEAHDESDAENVVAQDLIDFDEISIYEQIKDEEVDVYKKSIDKNKFFPL